MTRASEVLDLYEMTPAQAGMLFQSLYNPGAGVYRQQYWGRLEGALDEAAFRAAWDAVIARHDILRATCHWEEIDRPALAIHAEARPEWRLDDWRGPGAGSWRARLEDWLDEDRARGFDFAAPPLMRFALIRVAERSHVFVWTFHHLLLDGWCGATLVREALGIYAARPPGAPPPPFRAYVEWRETQDAEAARRYWTGRLAGIEGPTPLGLDRPEAGAAGAPGAFARRLSLGTDLTGRLLAVCRRERLTLATLMQGAWALVLSRCSGQEDVTFGAVLSGRPADLPGAEEMVGLFLQTVPVRVRAGDDREIWPWLREIQAEQRERERHGHAGLAEIGRWSGLPASTPLFESLLVVETYPESIASAVARGGGEIRLAETGVRERTNFPLTLTVLPGEDVEIRVAADAARLTPEAALRLVGHLTQALERFAAGWAGRLRDIETLDAAERDALAAFEEGPRPAPPADALSRLLATAASRGEAAAIETPGGARLSYAGLTRRADAIAAALRRRGVGRGDIVAICQDRTPDLVATLIAAWRCGAAYLPLDPAYPVDRIAYILEDAKAVLVVADEIGLGALGPLGPLPLLPVAECAEGDARDLPDRADGADLAYILYTSGSTGRPKGVPITHGALANFLGSMLREPGIGPSDRWLALTTIAFDIAALELFGPLLAGGTVILAETGAGIDGAGIARLIETRGATVAQATPTGWRVLRDSGWRGAPGLRMLSGGEALDSALARDLLKLGGELWNLYGPTETTIWSAALRLGPEHLGGPRAPVGGPLAHTTLTLRDPRGRRAPFGAAGELWIGGAGLSPGYLGRPELTAERFVAEGGARLYRTGDRMRRNPDGTLDFLGRLDDQVKLRGHRIELGEIEARLEAHEAVAQAVVAARGEGAAARLVAWLRPAGAAPSPAALRAHLAAALPAYMVPAVFVPVERFPLTPNGKIDRKALPAPEAAQRAARSTARPAAPPPGQRDEIVAGIWAEALGRAPAGPEDDFFALGGHSLAALQVIGETRRRLGVDLALRDLFEAPGFGRFCERIDAARGAPLLPAVARSAGAPDLSAAQRRQWLLARLDPARADYHLPLAVRLSGPLDPDALARAIAGLAARHDVLRCRFPSERGLARAEILPDFAPPLRRDDLAGLDDEARAAALERIRAEEAETPFAMETAPPWRARLLRLGDEAHLLLLTLHHILADEWSFGVMLAEIGECYLGRDRPRPEIQYPDFAAWQRALDLSAQRDYWRRQLAGAPAVAELPADRPRPVRRDGRAGSAALRVGPETARALEAMARENGATLFMLLLAAYAVLLQRHSGEKDIVIGAPVSNRRAAELHGLVGLFVNTLAIRLDLAGARSFGSVLARAREAVLSAHANQDLPFEDVIAALSPPRSERHAPLAQVMFAMPDPPRAGEIGGGLAWEAAPRRVARARFDLSLEIERTERGLEGRLDFAADIFDEATVERLARRLETLLEGLAAGATGSLDELPLLTAEDRAIALPAPRHPAPTGGPLDWLAAHATARPEAIALPGLGLDFAALRSRARAGAATLRHEGIAPGEIVGFEPAGPEAVVGLLAILEAGGTAAPLPADAAARRRLADVAGMRRAIPRDDQAGRLSAPAAAGAGGLVVALDPEAPTLFGPDIFGHLSRIAGEIGPGARVATGAALDSPAGLAAFAAALRAGAPLVFDGPPDAMTVEGGEPRKLRFGAPGDEAADVLSLPELPAALLVERGRLRPAPGVLALVLGDDGAPTPPSSVGRLNLGGPGLARGRLGAPARTAARLAPNPHVDPRRFSAADACLLRSGLRVRLDASGGFSLAPDPVARERLGGEAFAPERIEAEFASLPGIRAAALALAEGARTAERLVLFLEPSPGDAAPDEAALARLAGERLPESLAPGRFVMLDALPRRPDGAPDRAALARLVAAGRDDAPRGAAEEALAAIWRDVLELSRLGRNGDFFDLGGDSIRAVQVAARAAEAGLSIDPRDLFRLRTLAALAASARPLGPAERGAPDLPRIDDAELAKLAELVAFDDA